MTPVFRKFLKILLLLLLSAFHFSNIWGQGQGQVVIQAKTKVTVSLEKTPKRLIRISLREDAGEAVVQELVQIVIKKGEKNLFKEIIETDEKGQALLELPEITDRSQIAVSFAGNEFLGASQTSLIFEVADPKPAIQLKIVSDNFGYIQFREQLTLSVEVTGKGHKLKNWPVGLKGKTLQTETLKTNRQGVATFRLRKYIEIPGNYPFLIESSETKQFAKAATRFNYQVFSQVFLQLTIFNKWSQKGLQIEVGAEIKDFYGPVSGVNLDLYLNQDRIKTIPTTKEGTILSRYTFPELKEESFLVRLQYRPQKPYHRDGIEQAIKIMPFQPKKGNKAIYWIALGLIPLLLLGYVLYKNADRFRKYVLRKKSQVDESFGILARPQMVFQKLAARLLKSDSPKFFEISGMACDVLEKLPLFPVKVRLLLSPDQGRLERTNQKDGTFKVSDIPPGDYALSFCADSYVTESRKIQIPHSGKYNNFLVIMTPVRVRFRQLYLNALDKLAIDYCWGISTPCELYEGIIRQFPELKLTFSELTPLFLEIYYSQKRFPEAVLAHGENCHSAIDSYLADPNF